jgi:hypothetical protein
MIAQVEFAGFNPLEWPLWLKILVVVYSGRQFYKLLKLNIRAPGDSNIYYNLDGGIVPQRLRALVITFGELDEPLLGLSIEPMIDAYVTPLVKKYINWNLKFNWHLKWSWRPLTPVASPQPSKYTAIRNEYLVKHKVWSPASLLVQPEKLVYKFAYGFGRLAFYVIKAGVWPIAITVVVPFLRAFVQDKFRKMIFAQASGLPADDFSGSSLSVRTNIGVPSAFDEGKVWNAAALVAGEPSFEAVSTEQGRYAFLWLPDQCEKRLHHSRIWNKIRHHLNTVERKRGTSLDQEEIARQNAHH